MKTSALIITLAVGVLAAAPAHACNGINNATYALRYRSTAQPPAAQTETKFQVAVMANSPTQSSATKAGRNAPSTRDSRPWGPPRPYAVKSH